MKSTRHALIIDIIEKNCIETQEELAEALKKHGVNVTQATVSRDIKELRLLKVLTENGGYRYAVAEKTETGMSDRFIKIFAESVLTVQGAGNLIVIKTITATAQSAGEAIDSFNWPEVIGTIAGDNTVLVIVKNIEDVDEVLTRFYRLIGKRK